MIDIKDLRVGDLILYRMKGWNKKNFNEDRIEVITDLHIKIGYSWYPLERLEAHKILEKGEKKQAKQNIAKEGDLVDTKFLNIGDRILCWTDTWVDGVISDEEVEDIKGDLVKIGSSWYKKDDIIVYEILESKKDNGREKFYKGRIRALCPFMSTPTKEVLCTKNCMINYDWAGGCIFNRILHAIEEIDDDE